MISMVSSDAANAHSSQPRDESVHPLPPVSKDQKSPSTRSLMYKTSTGAEDLSSTLLDAIAPTLSESSHLPSSEEEPIPAIPASPPKPAKPTKPTLKLVKPAETPAKSGLKPAMKPRPAGKSEPAKSPAESPKPVKLLVKPPTKPSKPVTPSTKLPPTQSVKLPPIETPANIVPANSSLPANVVPAKTPIPAKSSIPAGEAVTVEMVQEMVVSFPRFHSDQSVEPSAVGGNPDFFVRDSFTAAEAAYGYGEPVIAVPAAAPRGTGAFPERDGVGGEEAVGISAIVHYV